MTLSADFMRRFGMLLLLASLTACSSLQLRETDAPENAATIEWPVVGAELPSATKWRHHTFPGKRSTHYKLQQIEDRQALYSHASSAASMLRQNLRVEAGDLGRLKFSWKVPALIPHAKLDERASDDSPVRVVLVFEGDRSTFSAKNAMLSELALTLTGEALPYATLMYVWDNHSAPGTLIVNRRTDRIRALVLESGAQSLGRWLDYERNIVTDFTKAFGEAPGALVAVGLMTDTDNTLQKTSAWYGPLTLLRGSVSD